MIGNISISVDRSGSFIPQIQIRHRVFDVVDYCWTAFGIGDIYPDGNSFVWYVSGQGDILYILQKMHPYLIEKDREVMILKEFLSSRMSHREHNKPYTKGELERILELSKEGTKAHDYARERFGESSSFNNF